MMRLRKKLFKIVKFLLGLVIFLGCGLAIYLHNSSKLDIKNDYQVYIYDDNKQLIYQGSGNNKWVSLDDISDNLINAVISTEDKNFYKHFGFDFLRIGKAFILNIKNGKIIQGASTISQQYIKNMYLSFDKTWERKLNEALLTLKLEAQYDKNDILEGYLNTINYGQGNYGIENASKYYFNKSAKDLNLEEAIILAGIPKSPNYYNPISNYDASISRAKVIAKLMYNNKYITYEEYSSLFKNDIEIYGKKNNDELKTLMYYQDAVYNELQNIDSIPKSLIESGGLKIYTSFNMEAQKTLEASIENYIEEDMQVASILVNPQNGNVIALVGGYDYAVSQYNRALSSKRQVGSTIKPLLYYAALENGMVSSSTFLSEPTTFAFANNNTYSPANFNDKYGNKNITMAAAISYSDNIYAVKTHLFLGEETLVNTAKRMGLKENLEPLPSLALGTCELNMMDYATAYTTLASGGYKRSLSFINKIEDNKGNLLYEKETDDNLVLNESYTYILNEMMTSTYNQSFVDYNTPTVMSIASKLTSKYAIKTGSSGTDFWVVGYNPNVLMMVWNGYDDNRELKVKDGTITKNIWVDTVEQLNLEKEWYQTPNNVVGIPLDAITGEQTEDTSKINIFYYVSGSEYNDVDTEYVYKEKNE